MRNYHFWLLIISFGVMQFCVSYAETDPLLLRETPIVRAVHKVEPAVVNISTEKVVSISAFNPFGDDWIFDYFRHNNRSQRNVTHQSLGSGAIIRSDGVILTNEHVILPASRINVTLADGREFEAELIGASRRFDLALLKIDAGEPLPYLSPASSADLMIGETVIAIGNPYGLSSTVTTGVLSAVDRTITFKDQDTNQLHTFFDFIQTDASINPGNSGGPLLNILGDLIGINTAIYSQAEGIGFAIPIDKAKRIIDDLLELGEVPRIWMGLQVQDLNDLLARHLNIDQSKGVLVSEVRGKSPALRAGVERGDLIIKVNNHEVHNTLEYRTLMREFTPGDKVNLLIIRDKEKIIRTMEAIAVPLDRVEELTWDLLGCQIRNMTQKDIRQYGRYATDGVIVKSVRPASPAEEVGIKRGDLLAKINRTHIKRDEDLYKQIPYLVQQDSVIMVVVRGSNAYRVTLTIQ
ncbi:trypsin-like peptidase domain-containing protein [bacterium]|nr:trypsin-like peptidase domain-containing protein [bacterium]